LRIRGILLVVFFPDRWRVPLLLQEGCEVEALEGHRFLEVTTFFEVDSFKQDVGFLKLGG
jgi:hypothetical protein